MNFSTEELVDFIKTDINPDPILSASIFISMLQHGKVRAFYNNGKPQFKINLQKIPSTTFIPANVSLLDILQVLKNIEDKFPSGNAEKDAEVFISHISCGKLKIVYKNNRTYYYEDNKM